MEWNGVEWSGVGEGRGGREGGEGRGRGGEGGEGRREGGSEGREGGMPVTHIMMGMFTHSVHVTSNVIT